MRSYLPKNQPELKLISLEDVVVEPVRWLWYPYIPLGKLSIIHGDPAEGKTTLALWIAAACSRGQALPGGGNGEPQTVLYQTAEDGLGDTIKPRLLESQADLQKIYTIDETDFPLSMLDYRIGEAIEKTHAQLMILDPMQAYLGEKVDMNRANEVRTVMKGLTKVANQTGCAIVLVGHLNKSQSINSAQRGLGSMDFRAAARSVLLVGRLKNDRDIRVMVHDKSSLAEEGPSRGFTLDNGTLHWQEGYENLTADELLSGRSPDSKLTLAEQLILDTLAGGSGRGDRPQREPDPHPGHRGRRGAHPGRGVHRGLPHLRHPGHVRGALCPAGAGGVYAGRGHPAWGSSGGPPPAGRP